MMNQQTPQIVNYLGFRDFLASIHKPGSSLWLGATDREKEGVFNWVDGNGGLEPLTISNWFPPEPNNQENDENCVISG